MCLRPDIAATRQMIRRVIDTLAEDRAKRALIAAKAAFEFIALDQGIGAALAAFNSVTADPMRADPHTPAAAPIQETTYA